MSALICLCYILTIIYCLKSSQVTAITISVLLLIYMFLVLFVILPHVYILSFFLPMFLSCLRLTNTFVFNIWCRVRTPLEYFSYMVAINSISGENLSILRIPPICRKSLTNFITYCFIEYI